VRLPLGADVAGTVLAPNDGVGIVVFNHEAKAILLLTPKHTLMDKGREHLQHGRAGTGFRCGGSTKLWDSIAAGMQMLSDRARVHAPKPSHPFFVVLTDGSDNASVAFDAASVQTMLEKPKSAGFRHMQNFHGSLISVGGEAGMREQFDRIVQGKPHLQHFTASSAADIASMFVSVRAQLL
jgi:Mg-chelatase subunit ChlD